MTTAHPRLGVDVLDDLDRRLAPVDAELDPLAALVLGPERHARHVLVEGEYVVRDGTLLGADIHELRRELARRARRLWPQGAT